MTKRPGLKRPWRALAAAVLLAGLSGGAMAETLSVEVTAAAGETADIASLVRAAAPSVRSVARRPGRSAIVEVDAAGYRRLMADTRFETVAIVSGVAATDPAPAALSRYRIALIHPSFAPRAGVEAHVAAGAAADARLIERRSAGRGVPDSGPLGPGLLEARLLDAGGKLLARTVVTDPRIVRSEGADASGRLTESHVFIRARSELEVLLPTVAGAVTLDISEPVGPAHRPRVIARLVIR